MHKVLSLFSGAMGFDLGLEQAGLSVILSSDFDKHVRDTMIANNRPHIYGDIREMIKEDPSCSFITEKTGDLSDLFAIVGGPPCQPFSTMGARGGFNDVRGSLFKEFLHTIDTFKPRFFIMENVKGLLSLKTDDDIDYIDIILKDFTDIGYTVKFELLNAVYYGVPQFRERLILIGSRDDEDIFFPQPTHFKIHQNKNYRWQTLRDCFSDIDYSNDEVMNLSENRAKFLPHIPEAGNWKSLPPHLQEEAMGGAFKSGGGKTGFYRRLSFEEPSPTLVTNPIQKSTMLLHPKENRALSVKEYKRIQQFPDDWKIVGTLNSQYRQVGNAVPVGLGKALGETLLAIAENTQTVQSKRPTKPFLREESSLNKIM